MTPNVPRSAETPDLEESFREVYETYAESIYNYTLRMMGNEFDAADLTQDTFMRAYAALKKEARDYQIRPWLYRIATNACLDELRRRGVIRWQPLEIVGEHMPFQPREPQTPERLLLYVEDMRNVRHVLDQLSSRHRTVLLLREQQELSYDEICQVLDKPLSAVKSLLFRAREEFRKVYLREFGPENLP
jgi:RNA polymerase sigma-70 factor (ECF subfamily)